MSTWEMVKLTDVCDFQGGSQPPKEQWIGEAREGYVRMLQIRDFTRDRSGKQEYVKKTANLKTCEQADVLIARYGASTGKILTGLAGAYNVAIIKTIPNLKRLNRKYLRMFLLSDTFQNHIAKVGSRAAQAGFNKTDLEGIPIPLPSLEMQENIARTLEAVEELAVRHKQQIAELDELIKAVFYRIFGDPVTNEMGWETVKLKDIADCFIGLTYKPEDVADQGTIVLRSGNIQNDKLELNNIVRVKKPIREKLIVRQNDILMCSRNGSKRLVGKTALIGEIKEPMSFGAFMTIIRTRYYSYLLTYFRTEAFRRQLSNAETTTINQITKGMLDQIELPLPGISAQDGFASVVAKIEEQKNLRQKAAAENQSLFNSLMNKYFA